jgi:hypothetical protein
MKSAFVLSSFPHAALAVALTARASLPMEAR